MTSVNIGTLLQRANARWQTLLRTLKASDEDLVRFERDGYPDERICSVVVFG